jgi:hypothetical protein
MYHIFVKIDEERERVKQDCENIKCGRQKHRVDAPTTEYFYRLNATLTSFASDLQEYVDTDKHMLLGGEYRKNVYELERLYNRYKDIPYDMPIMKRMMNELKEFEKDLYTMRKRINVFSYCKVCYKPYHVCRARDKDACQYLITNDRYKMYEPSFSDTCKGCEYASADVKFHIGTGGCLADKKINPEDLKGEVERAEKMPDGSFWKYKRAKTAAQIEEDRLWEESEKEGLTIRMNRKKCVLEGFSSDGSK